MMLETEATLVHGECMVAVGRVFHPSCFGKTEATTTGLRSEDDTELKAGFQQPRNVSLVFTTCIPVPSPF